MSSFTASRASGTPTDDATRYMGHPVALDTHAFEQPERKPDVVEVTTEPVKPVGRYARRGKRAQ